MLAVPARCLNSTTDIYIYIEWKVEHLLKQPETL